MFFHLSNSLRRHWPVVALFVMCMSICPGRTSAQESDTLLVQARGAIERAVAYFSHPSVIPDPDAVLLHSYVKDRFGLPEPGYTRSVLSQIRSDSTSQLYMFLRLAEPRPCEMHFLAPHGPDDMTLAGLWYDELDDPSLLMERINETSWGWDEPYMVTHALWAMAMARNCFQATLDTAVERRLVDLNQAIMTKNRPLWNDVAIEALAMAQYHDPSYVPPAEYIQEIMGLQDPKGSWNREPKDNSTASQHTTILALWALLQYRPLGWPVLPRDMAHR